MAIRSRAITIVTMLAVLGAARAEAGQGQTEPLPLRVVVYDFGGVATPVLKRAQRLVSGVFTEAGVDVRWLDQAGFASAIPTDPVDRKRFAGSTVQVRLVPPAMHRALGLNQDALGTAGSGTGCVWISVAGIQEAARLSNADVSDVLGYVIAHEIGHVLLPLGWHAVAGLMQDDLDPHLIARNRLFFLPQEAVLIRMTLQSRMGVKTQNVR